MPTKTEVTELKERVFAPGNLVHGYRLNNLRTSIFDGIRTGVAIGYERYSPYDISFAMMSNQELPTRYYESSHFGPKGPYITNHLSLIISREGLQSRFPNECKAIGDRFRSPSQQDLDSYLFDEERKQVYGFPIDKPHRLPPYKDEVRLYTQQILLR